VTGAPGFAAADDVFEEFLAGSPQPGAAWGVAERGQLVHVGGRGHLWDGGPTPDGDSVFRIASMTKSFTATCLLGLRDAGLLALDDPAETYVPALAGRTTPTSDARPATIRDLLTMSSGLPTDDAWGDRQLPIRPERLDELIAAGFRYAWAPGTAFEYSNLGYALLGRVVATVGGGTYQRVVRERVLDPLGLSATGYHAAEVPNGRLAHGHQNVDGAWVEVPLAGSGEFDAMGGLFSSLRDLARWAGMFADAFPARDGADAYGHVLARASRREMQQIHRAAPIDPFPSDRPNAVATLAGYGYGLFVEHDPDVGLLVSHPGGLPGFGSSMRWHPASGLGVVALGNATYWGPTPPVARALDALLASRGVTLVVEPWPETVAAQRAVLRLLDDWDDELAAALFAENVAMDDPLPRRRAAIEGFRARLGALSLDAATPPVVASPAAMTWWMTGERGRLQVRIELTPTDPPAVQTLELTAVS